MSQRDSGRRRITLDLSQDLVDWLDVLKAQMGFRSRGPLLEQLLTELRGEDDDEAEADPASFDRSAEPLAGQDRAQTAGQGHHDTAAADTVSSSAQQERRSGLPDDSAAIILIRSDTDATLDQAAVSPRTGDARRGGGPSMRAGNGGIELPGFVRRQAKELQRSLTAESQPLQFDAGMRLVHRDDLQAALLKADAQWLEVYGQAPSEAVVDAALTWLARDVWPQSDHSDARAFSWVLAEQVLSSLAPNWQAGPPDLARVITAAGILEDPFSGSTLALRVPTLITRFVQRQRSRQKRTMSFDAIDQSMTVHTALRLLQLPTVADRPYSFKEIRFAYLQQAQNHHPDAGGSADLMRRLNEAYQFLKERYRRAPGA